jgi:hypothetical protein
MYRQLFPSLLFFFLLILAGPFAFAQGVTVKGRVVSATDNTPLPTVVLSLSAAADSSRKWQTVTDIDGLFSWKDIPSGSYHLSTAYLSYNAINRAVVVAGQALDMGTLKLEASANRMKGVVVKSTQLRGEQTGDTTQFNADAFKTNPDATAEDLVRKMPGISSDNEGLKINGEKVKQVLVDGKPFFGNDPSASLKNLPADIVDKVQLFDKQSDQSRFSGFDDGNAEKTINLVTKNGKNKGQFGKMYAGYGTDTRNNLGGSLNIFNGVQRISVLAMSNNINQQNFSIDDIMSVMSNSGSGSGGGPGGPGGGGNAPGGGGGAANFFSGQQNGITKTTSVGINYTDAWGKKIAVSGSYFFNKTDNNLDNQLTRTFFNGDGQTYRQQSSATTLNTNHRLNFRMEYNIDSMNAIIITPRLTVQQVNSNTSLNGSNLLADIIRNQTSSNTMADNTGYNFNNNILFQHKFRKKGRSVSLNLGTQINNRDGNGSYYSSTVADVDTNAILYDQQYTLINKSTTLSGNITYTEPIGKNSQVMISYNPSVTTGSADKLTNNKDELLNTYTDADTSLSNKYENKYTTQRAGIGYRYNKAKLNFNIGLDAQRAELSGEQVFPTLFTINKTFTNALPNAMLNYKFSKTTNLNINYRSSTTAPTISQLQDVLDISNPLQIRSGDAGLKQTFDNRLMMRYGRTNSHSRNFFIFLMANYTKDYISNATTTFQTDTQINGYQVTPGSQLTRPVNLDGYWNAKTFAVYSFPVSAIKSNLNLNGGLTYTRNPALINELLNYSTNYAANAGFYLGSNISPAVDFSVSYNGAYTVVRNSLQAASNNAYYSHNATAKVNWMPWKGLVINSDVTHTTYSGLGAGYDQQYYLWNAYVGYKFLKNRSLEAKISAFDILDQNRSISRNITETYTEDTRSNILQRYLMFTLTYTLKNFKSGTAPNDGPQHPAGMPPGPPPGMMMGRPPMN